MVFSGTLCTEAEIESKEGANVSTSVTEAMHNLWTANAESYVNAVTRYNWTDNFAGLDADLKAILSDTVSSYVALFGIAYDMSGYTSRVEAQVMLDLNYAIVQDNVRILKEKVATDFIKGT